MKAILIIRFQSNAIIQYAACANNNARDLNNFLKRKATLSGICWVTIFKTVIVQGT